MKVHFLGTAAAEGFPNPYCKCQACVKARELGGKNKRTRSSVLFDDWLKVDYPPDTMWQADRDGIDLSLVTELLITHTHYDHLNAGALTDRLTGYAHGVEQPLNIYGNDLTLLKCRSELSGETIGDDLRFHRLLPFHAVNVGEARVTPLLADHDQREMCLLFYIEMGGKTILYGNDTGWFPDDTWDFLAGRTIDLAILDCTTGSTGNKRQRNHMSIETVLEVGRIFREEGHVKKNSQIFVTHFSHNCRLLHEDLVEIFEPEGIQVAYDGLVTHI
ncbi:MBL fold metallo-hydrolase [Camelliibacillus cellulosilyticus]|uniref:MBL fold metallo-hydrolase n=1 Tax=Camelliibacillus cellulosilyticus TaxID=2174486 RepID=A0ABV9GKK0_9BACL